MYISRFFHTYSTRINYVQREFTLCCDLMVHASMKMTVHTVACLAYLPFLMGFCSWKPINTLNSKLDHSSQDVWCAQLVLIMENAHQVIQSKKCGLYF